MNVSLENFIQTTEHLLAKTNINLPQKFVIAYSGGLDSSVLLHLFQEWRKINASIQVVAVHINHQLQPQSNVWQRHCAGVCQTYGIEFSSEKVIVENSKKKGIESAARDARYATLKKYLSNDEILVTAHQQDDQIETLFYRLLRGTGIEGAAAMQGMKPFANAYLMRPLLDYSRNTLEDYANKQNLTWINDPSNTDNTFDRNYLRNEVLTSIEKRWPAYAESVTRFCRNAAETQELLQDYIAREYDQFCKANYLLCEKLLTCSIAKQKVIIRYWLQQQEKPIPAEKQLYEIIKMLSAREDAMPVVSWADTEVRRFQHKLYVMTALRDFDTQQTFIWDGVSELEIPDVGILIGKTTENTSNPHNLEIRFRQGGENCQIPGRNGSHSLKKLFQENNIAPWLRDRTPIIYDGNTIVAIPGVFSINKNISFISKI